MLEAIVSRFMTLAITAGLATAPAVSPSVAATTAPAVVREVGATVHMHGSAFVPARVVIHAGEAVAFENDDDVAHDATAADGSFATPELDRGGVAMHAFLTPGTIAYGCADHAFMHGTIVVLPANGASIKTKSP